MALGQRRKKQVGQLAGKSCSSREIFVLYGNKESMLLRFQPIFEIFQRLEIQECLSEVLALFER